MNEIVALIVEDNEMLSELYAQALQEAGFQTERLPDGQVALERLHAVTPGLVLVDLHLPQVSGEKLLAYMHENPRFKQTHTIVASADGSWTSQLNQQADFVLNKPVSYKQLRALASRLYMSFAPEKSEGVA